MGVILGSGGGVGGSVGLYAKIEDRKSSTTEGGTFTSDAYRTRDLNTKSVDNIGITLSSNQFTLPAGTYWIRASAPSIHTTRHKLRLQNITDVTTVTTGSSEFADVSIPVQTRSFLIDEFMIATPKVFELQHRCQTTRTDNGFGVQNGFGDNEVYTIVELTKVA